MKRVSVFLSGVVCCASLIATCLGATGVAGDLTSSEWFASDRKASFMTCNGGLAYGWIVAVR